MIKSHKFLEWDNYFRQGITIRKPLPCKVQSYCKGDSISIADFGEQFENICLAYRFNVAPKLIDAGIHKANRLFRYYTFKELPGAVIFLGAK